jgi:WbqC-like protein family
MPELAPHLGSGFGKLEDITVPLIRTISRLLGCKAGIITKTDPPSRTPRDFRLVEEEGFRVIEMKPFTYRQAFPGFVGSLSVLDLLFNHGPRAREMILTNSSVSALQTESIE